MPGPWRPDMSEWREVIDLGSPKDADNYINAGWILIENRDEINGNLVFHIWRLGWPKDAGEPIRPEVTNEPPPPEFFSSN